jgi:hypothetical protein
LQYLPNMKFTAAPMELGRQESLRADERKKLIGG